MADINSHTGTKTNITDLLKESYTRLGFARLSTHNHKQRRDPGPGPELSEHD